MRDHATSLSNVTQPQFPPTAAERAAKRRQPGKVFREKAIASRRVSNQSLEKMHLVELPGGPGADRT